MQPEEASAQYSQRISAIISAYFAEDFLEARLENLMYYSSEKPEIVAVALKGSKEAHILHKYAMKRDGVNILLTEDIPTVYAAWNMAIKASHGLYITNANCDDLVFKDSYAYMADMLFTSTYDMVYGDVIEIPANRVRHFYGDGLEDMLKCCYGSPMPMWKRSVHDEIGYFNESYHVAGDYEFWLRMLKYGYTLGHCGIIVGEYLNRPDSVEHRESYLTIQETSRARSTYHD